MNSLTTNRYAVRTGIILLLSVVIVLAVSVAHAAVPISVPVNKFMLAKPIHYKGYNWIRMGSLSKTEASMSRSLLGPVFQYIDDPVRLKTITADPTMLGTRHPME